MKRVQNPEDDARYRGLLGAWNHPDEDLPFVMRSFANAMPVAYRGWAEVIRGWAYRLEREPDPALPSEEHSPGCDGNCNAGGSMTCFP